VPEEVTGIDIFGHSPCPQGMNVSLTPELERMVNDPVRSGMYQTASEVVREALRTLKDRDSQGSLRRDVQEGFAQIDRGEYEEYDETTIKDLVADIATRGKKGWPRSARVGAGESPGPHLEECQSGSRFHLGMGGGKQQQ
jgi:antitoxin ParD1/3/4